MPQEKPERDVKKIWFMTGAGHWYQTAFCLWSFIKNSRHKIRPVILDDGTLESEQVECLRTIAPSLHVERACISERRFAKSFPQERFPWLHFWREKQILLRKLIDVHTDSSEWRVFFDSDMLFFNQARELDDYLEKPESPLVQEDCVESYGYSRGLTEQLVGQQLPEKINIGIFALNGGHIDWHQVEYWLGRMVEKEGTRYNITQCVCAMLMAGTKLQYLNSEDYKVWSKEPGGTQRRILEHYVADSKPFYFQQAWHDLLNQGSKTKI